MIGLQAEDGRDRAGQHLRQALEYRARDAQLIEPLDTRLKRVVVQHHEVRPLAGGDGADSCSRRSVQAASMVTPRRACISVRHSLVETTWPLALRRLAAHQARVSGSVGAIMKSEWKVTFMPARSIEPQRVICDARSGPRPKPL